jgi:hypothetical protein
MTRARLTNILELYLCKYFWSAAEGDLTSCSVRHH